MEPSADACVALLRQLRVTGQLQHAWFVQGWQAEQGPQPAAAMLLADLDQRGELRVSELAKLRMVDISVVSRQIAQLAGAGLIDRRPAPEDGRVSLVSVSDEGRRWLARWRGAHVEFLRRALDGWADEDVTSLAERLAAANAGLRTALDTGAERQERPVTDEQRR